ncbi:MAG TPA: phosphotransferase, partial [Solirubrobacteraceae bacterium]|nr:phosphotransferase [Solirubrobacteraceae bacterium]
AIGYPLDLAAAAGRAVGEAHRSTRDLAGEAPAALPWALFALDRDGPAAFAWSEAPLRAVLEGLAEPERFVAALEAARAAWRPECLVHGDLKWDNCLVADGDGGAPTVLVVDWESAGVGDPAWDVAGIVQEYLGYAALMGLEVSRARFATAMEIGGIAPLVDALRAFFDAYAGAAAVPVRAERDALAVRAVRLAGARLVQTGLEHASRDGERNDASASLAALAPAMLSEPEALASHLGLAEGR